MTGSAVSWCLFTGVVVLAVGVVVTTYVLPREPLAIAPVPLVATTTAHSISPVTVPHSTSTSAVLATTLMSQYDRLWLLGDVMLSRQVGQYALERGFDFPWRGFASQVAPRDAVLVNFEACVSEERSFDWSQSMRFPVRPVLLPAMASTGVSHASLANNHALDCGVADYHGTKAALARVGITAFGHPTTLTSASVATTSIGSSTVGIMAFHTLFALPTTAEFAAVAQLLEVETDLQIAYVHWGEEYEQTASVSQRTLARALVNLGFDLVVGHHPHVVQDIERVGDAVIVYSLGNFIFDQYFSTEVQEGLTLVLDLRSEPQLQLVPVTSRHTRTQPEPMDVSERERFLRSLADRSAPELGAEIGQGRLTLRLATSTKPGMIAP